MRGTESPDLEPSFIADPPGSSPPRVFEVCAQCRSLTPSQRRNLLSGPCGLGRGDPTGTDEAGDMVAMILYTADVLSWGKHFTSDDLLVVLDSCADLFRQLTEQLSTAWQSGSEVPQFRVGIIDDRYVVLTGWNKALDLYSGLKIDRPKKDLRTVTYNITEVYVRQWLAKKWPRSESPASGSAAGM